MRASVPVLVALALAAPLLVASPAAAQTASELFAEGAAAHDRGDLEAARAKYAASFAMHQAPQTAANLGVVEGLLGRHRDAAEHLAFALARYRDEGDEARRRRMAEELSRVLGYVGELRVEAPAGARIVVDGAPVGTAPLVVPIYVEPGTHRVEARVQGDGGAAAPAPVELTVEAGEARELRLEVGPAATSEEPLAPRVDLAGPRYVGIDEPARIDPVLVVGGLGLAVAGGALGTAFAFASDGGDGLEAASIASFAAGGAALVATGVYVIVVAADDGGDVQRSGAASLVVSPTGPAGGAGLTARGAF